MLIHIKNLFIYYLLINKKVLAIFQFDNLITCEFLLECLQNTLRKIGYEFFSVFNYCTLQFFIKFHQFCFPNSM